MTELPRLQPLVRTGVAALGDRGRAWHEALPGLLARLADTWGLTWGRPLPGGSASYVCSARTHDGAPRAVKVPVPGHDLATERRVLAAADGRGYVHLHDHDPVSGALLLELLGPGLDRSGRPPEEQLTALADTLHEAWAVDLPALPGQEDKALGLHRLVSELDARLGRPTDRRVLRVALDHADRLAGWSGPTVTVHGDPHPANTLRAPDGRGSGWLLVDPDGFRADPAYDAGVTLRDWCGHLRGSDARQRLRTWTALVSDHTGLDAERVWAWAFLERVSTGLYVWEFGAQRVARPFLESAEALLSAPA